MNKRIIAICGRKNSGKTTIINICKEKFDFDILYFSDIIKNLVCKVVGIKRQELEENLDIQKEIYLRDNNIEILVEILNIKSLDQKDIKILKTPFQSIHKLLNFIEKKIIINYNKQWYIEELEKITKNYKGDKICIGDCKFSNEKEFIEKIGGETWYIINPNDMDISNDDSEISLTWEMFNGNRVMINNDINILSKKWCDYIQTNTWELNISIYNNKHRSVQIYNQLKNPFIISFIKNPTKENAEKMIGIIENPLLLEDLKLLLNK